jgi:hypothetical protein
MSAPPVIQEIVMGKTSEKIKEKLKDEAVEEVKKDNRDNMYKILPHIVPEIMDDIISSHTTAGRVRRNFREVYSNLDPEMIECATKIAETTVQSMEQYYVHRVMNNNQQYYDDYSSESEPEYPDSDDLW